MLYNFAEGNSDSPHARAWSSSKGCVSNLEAGGASSTRGYSKIESKLINLIVKE